jgi:hypothetical protein
MKSDSQMWLTARNLILRDGHIMDLILKCGDGIDSDKRCGLQHGIYSQMWPTATNLIHRCGIHHGVLLSDMPDSVQAVAT